MAESDMQNSSEPAVKAEFGEDDIDAAIDQEVMPDASLDASQAGPLGLDGANDSKMDNDIDVTAPAPALETRISAKKDISLREFLPKMDEFAPIVCLLLQRALCAGPLKTFILCTGNANGHLRLSRFRMQSQTTT